LTDDLYDQRKELTFAQAEGAEPLPTQLSRTKISLQLASLVWADVHHRLRSSRDTYSSGNRILGDWDDILRDYHVFGLHQPIDEFLTDSKILVKQVKTIIYSYNYVRFMTSFSLF
jgi:hypothetical protein